MNRDKSQTELLADISLKLDTIMAFLASKVPQSEENALVDKLAKSGLSYDVIARVVGISENAAAIRLTRIRKKSGNARKRIDSSVKKVTANDQSSAQEGAPG